MGRLLEDCLRHTGRTYPDGYGFALAYLDDGLTPAVLLAPALRAASRALTAGRRSRNRLDRKDDDVLRFVAAQGTSQRCEDWLVEGAQLVLAAALAGDAACQSALGRCGHPGYSA